MRKASYHAQTKIIIPYMKLSCLNRKVESLSTYFRFSLIYHTLGKLNIVYTYLMFYKHTHLMFLKA